MHQAFDFHAIVEVSPYPYLIIGRDFTLLHANRAYLDVTGRSLSDLQGKTIFEAFPAKADDPNAVNMEYLRNSIARAFSTGEVDTIPLIRYAIAADSGGDGEFVERYWSATHTPVIGDDGEVAYVVQNTIDVTDLHNANRFGQASPLVFDMASHAAGVPTRAEVLEALKRILATERNYLQKLFEQAPSFIAVLSCPDFVFEVANDAYYQLVGRRDILGKRVWDALPDIAGQGYEDLLEQVRVTGKAVTGRGMKVSIRRDAAQSPEDAYIDLLYQPITGQDGDVIAIFVQGHDVTEAHIAQLALQQMNESLERRVRERTRMLEENEARMRSILQTSFQFQGFLDLQGILLDANQASLDGIGATLEKVVGRPFWDTPWFTGTTGMPAIIQAAVAQVAAGATIRQELEINLPVGGLRSFDFSIRPIRDASGNTIGILPEAVETTERKATEAALRQSQKMEAIGQLTGGIAHDFNNMLAAVMANLELLQLKIHTGSIGDLDRHVRAAMGATARCSTLTQRLLAFSRRQTLDARSTNVNALVTALTDLLQRTVGPHIQLQTDFQEDIWNTRCDPHQLENAVLNLAINARDAMPDGGAIRIETRNMRIDEAGMTPHSELSPGDYVLLSVTDHGVGMTPEVLSRALEPFFTTKPAGSGTGLGLPMIYGFVSQSKGHMNILSEAGRGTTVQIYLRRQTGDSADQVAEQEPAAAVAGSQAAPGKGSVLLVDDEPDLRSLLAEVLRSDGYEVAEASNAAEGLDVIDSSLHLDLLVTDVGLPGGINGRQLADAARVRRHGLKTLFVTGFAGNAALGEGALESGMEVLTKPFSIAVLTARVAAMLNTESAGNV